MLTTPYLYLNHNHNLNLNPYQYQLSISEKAGSKLNGKDSSVRKYSFSLLAAPKLKAVKSYTLAYQLQRPQ